MDSRERDLGLKTLCTVVVRETFRTVTRLMAEGKRRTFTNDDIDQMFETKQSSMPENLASVLAPTEFLDVVEYLTTLKYVGVVCRP